MEYRDIPTAILAARSTMVLTEPITIHVNPEAARAYQGASVEERRKLDLLLRLELRDAFQSDNCLQTVMRDISRQAKQRGLTLDTLESILRGVENV